ncbi:PaaI family thioesterase [Sphingomonas sp. So64.6b]|uniref:PaaI family thioesterase n=1 Tax=Sphingomonas sp. So64.6b TaxID=2997354 RepID=UPI0015FECC92|nr:PaaI family thioesterase [Sphingomonas sp. So64.6b]QNA83329.1 PaaI family thioesterase [Sphingomonas sp. So64.6b]
MSALSGLEQLRAMIASNAQPPIGRTLDFSLVEVDEGRAVFEGNPDARTYNPLGTVHGGYAATLLDSACGIATHSKLASGQAYTTLELKVSYHRAMTADTGPIRAEGAITAFGRRVAFAEAKLTDANGRLLASATSTLLVITP